MIKNIIFDFGAVLLPIEESLSWKALEKLGATEELKDQHKIFQSYEVGKLTTDKFLEKTQPFFFRKKIFKGDLAKAWNAMLYQRIESEKIYLLKRLRKKGFKLFLLSNTNDLHISSIKESAGPFDYGQFIKQFHEVYYSHEVGMRKPDAKIYQKVLSDHKLKASECLFIDDKEENIEAAAKLKIKTWHFNVKMDDVLELPKEIANY